jgi:DNA-binding CsgD family transcriptional regulator
LNLQKIDHRAMRGRWSEWQQAVEAMTLPPSGANRLILIVGPPGSGKTMFLRNLAAAGTTYGFHTIDLTIDHIGHLIPHQRGSQPPDPIDAALARIAGTHTDAPMLVVLDQPPWSDPGWPRRLTAPPADRRQHVVWAVTGWWGVDAAPVDLAYPANGPITRIDLGPLMAESVTELVTDLLSAAPSDELLDLAVMSDGCPGSIVELVAGMREDGMLRLQGGVATVASDGLPRRIHESVRRKLAQITLNSRHAMQVASTIGMSFSLIELADLLQVAVASLVPTINEALLVGLLQCCRLDILGFQNELIRRAVLETVPEPVRIALQTDAHRLREATLPRQAGPWAAADRPTAPSTDPIVATITANLATGQLHDVISQAREALAHGQLSAAAAAETQCLLAEALIFAGEATQAVAAVSPLLEDATLPDRWYTSAQANRLLALSLCDSDRAVAEATAYLDGPPRRADDPRTVVAATVLSNLCWGNGEMGRGLKLAREAVAHIGPTTPVNLRPHARLSLARKLADCRLFDEANAVIEQTEAEGEDLGARAHAASVHLARSRLHARAGRIVESKAEASRALALSSAMGSGLLAPPSRAALATAALRNGDLLTAAEHVQRFRGLFDAGISALWSAQYAWVELLLAYEQEGPRRAVKLLSKRREEIMSRQLLFIEEPGAGAWLVRLAKLAGDSLLVERVITCVKTMAESNPDFPLLGAGVRHAEGLAHGDTEALAQALQEHEDPWAAAWAAEDLGQLLILDRSRANSSIESFEHALHRFEAIGADRDAARVRMRLRALGVHRRKAQSPHEDASAQRWTRLAEIERTIIHFIQCGLTNRQIATRVFLSPHTVNYHLRQIYKKLGLQSRVQLAHLAQIHLPTGETPEVLEQPLPGQRHGTSL